MSNRKLINEKKRIPSLDGWRAVSIIYVLCSHCPISEGFPAHLKPFFKLIFDDGHLGVRCFFVISGFIITLLLLREQEKNGKIDLKKFYIRRCLRIFPVYYSFLFVVWLLQNTTQFSQPTVVWLQNLTFTTGFGFPAIFSWPTWHLWSLAVEEQFYLIWPFLFALLNHQLNSKAIKIALFVPLVLAPIIRLLAYAGMGGEVFSFGVNKHTFLFNFDAIAIGCIGAFIYKMPEFPKFLNQKKILAFGVLLVIVPEVFKRIYIFYGCFIGI